MQRRVASSLAAVLALFSGCAQHYMPRVDLSESSDTIPIVVELHRFKEASEARMPGQPYGLIAPHVKTAQPGELAEPITEAVLDDFRTNHVFQHIGTYADHPDAILTGTIRKFYETYRPKRWTRLPGAKVLADLIEADTYTATAEVDLEIMSLEPNGARIGTYRGHAIKTDDFIPSNQNEPGARLNWALSEAVQQVRQALLRDEKLASGPRVRHQATSRYKVGAYAHDR
jgi:hypothetical protein